MNWLFDQFFGRMLQQETDRYLRQLALAPTLASRKNATEVLRRLAAAPGAKVTLGETAWGEPVDIPFDEITKAHGLVTGGTGAAKSMFALLILNSLIDSAP